MQASDIVVTGLKLRAQELDLVAESRDQRGVILSSVVQALSTHLSRAVHPVQHDAPAAVGRLEANNSAALQAFAQCRDGQAEDASSGGQIDAVQLVVHHVQPLSYGPIKPDHYRRRRSIHRYFINGRG